MKNGIPWATVCMCGIGLLTACGGDSDTQDTSSVSTALKLQPVASNLNSPVFLTAPRGDANRLFVVEQGGTVKVLDRATGSALSTFLILTGITSGGERGLLGLAFDPNYNANGRFYAHYTEYRRERHDYDRSLFSVVNRRQCGRLCISERLSLHSPSNLREP